MNYADLIPSATVAVWHDALSRSTPRHTAVLSQPLVDALAEMGLSTSIVTEREQASRSTPLQALVAMITVICLSSKMHCRQYVQAALCDPPRFWEQQTVRRCLIRLLGWRLKEPKAYLHALAYGLIQIMPDELERASCLDQSRYLEQHRSKWSALVNQNSYQTPTFGGS